MFKSRTGNTALIRKEITNLEKEGCEIIRMAIPDRDSLLEMKNLIGEKAFKVPVVADIHFDTELAVEAIECGADCVNAMGGVEKLAK